jgi:programmed cell death 6-interacting protein
MAAQQGQINVMLAIHAKRTVAVDMQKPLRNYIVQHYSEREAQDMEEDIEDVNKMRSEVERSTDALEQRRDLLQRYFRALSVMESRFPISSEREHVNTLHFTWYDAFRQGRKGTQQNIHFEKAAIAFNLGAVQSQIALSADRTTPTGLKQACGAFQAAAGVFAFLRDNISMKAAGTGNNSTTDISVECAGMLERLMLAQAQECFFEKVVADNKPSLCSKVAKQVGSFYEEAYAALVLPPLNQHMDRTWTAHVQLKAAQFNAEACYRAALDLHEKENIPEEIARLKAGSSLLAEARKQSKGAAVGPLQDVVAKLEMNINRNLERANKENDRVYLMRVPSPDSLPPLTGAALAKSTNVADVLDASKEKMFAGLVPDSSAKALSKYTEMVDDTIRTQAEKLQQESEIMRVRLKEMDLPDSLRALEGTAPLSDDLRDDVEAVQLDGGPAGLETEMRQLRDLRRVNEELLAQTEELLEKESREDAQIRAQFGTRWTRPQSSTLTKTLHDRANGFAGNLKQAGDSDARIERTIRDNMPLMSILDAKPIESALPSLGRPMLSLDGNEDQIVGALRQRLAELEQCASQRAGLEDMLKDMKRKDNILPKLMTTSGSYEDLFKKELGKYDLVSQEVARNIENQERLFRQIKMHNDAFAATFNLKDFNNQKEKAFNQVRAAVAKYREIRENINEGLKFYVTLQDAITNLKQQCSDYVMTRSIQCREMMDDLQRQIAGLSFSNDNRPSRTYPSVGAAAPAAAPSQDSSYYTSGSAPSYGAQAPARPPYYAGQHQAGMPPPPYYAQPPAQAPSHSQNFAQPPYPGWQGPYYNGPPAPPAAPQTPQAPHPGAPPQPPHHGGFFSAFYKQ